MEDAPVNTGGGGGLGMLKTLGQKQIKRAAPSGVEQALNAWTATVTDAVEKRNSVADSSTEPLNAGDTIFLTSVGLGGDQFFLTAEGFSRPSVYVANKQPENFRECLFRICYPLSYDSHKSAKKLIGGMTRALQKQLLSREDARNDQSLEQKVGSAFPITYGQAIQLQHVKSGRFLTVVAGVPALVDRDCVRMQLVDGGNDGSQFELKPILKMRSAGSSVFSADQVKLLSLKPQDHSLHASKPPFRDGEVLNTKYPGLYEVNLCEESAAGSAMQGRRARAASQAWQDSEHSQWHMHLFTAYQPPEERSVSIGTVIRLFHHDLEGYLSIRSPQSSSPQC